MVDAPSEIWVLKLYVAGATPRSRQALENIQHFCANYLKGNCSIEVIDIRQHPERAKQDQIVAIPTLIRTYPLPIQKLVGCLSDTEKVRTCFDLKPLLPAR